MKNKTKIVQLGKASQLVKLARHLGAGKSISPAEAKEVYGITRLAARVYDLNQMMLGHSDRAILAVNRTDEEGHRYTRYRLACGTCRHQLRKWAKDQGKR